MSAPQKKRPTVEGRGAIQQSNCKKASNFKTGRADLQLPRAGTCTARILAELLAGRRLMPEPAWRRFGTSRLAAIMHNLRAAGWPIHSERVAVRCADGRIAHVARYSMGGRS